MIRWIGYASQNIPGNQSFDLGFFPSLQTASDAYLAYCEGVGTDDVTMTLYAVPADGLSAAEMIESAREFQDVGCPFDYPSKVIERGPRGGIKIEGC